MSNSLITQIRGLVDNDELLENRLGDALYMNH